MTEEDWETSPDPRAMLAWVVGRGLMTRRKRSLLLSAIHPLATLRDDWTNWAVEECKPAARLADLVRELFGNPCRRVRRIGRKAYALVRSWPPEKRPHDLLFVDEWLSWESGLVLRLAQAIEEENAWGRLPYLGDALEEAGCFDEPFLSHLRSSGRHARGCWALDLVLGKE